MPSYSVFDERAPIRPDGSTGIWARGSSWGRYSRSSYRYSDGTSAARLDANKIPAPLPAPMFAAGRVGYLGHVYIEEEHAAIQITESPGTPDIASGPQLAPKVREHLRLAIRGQAGTRVAGETHDLLVAPITDLNEPYRWRIPRLTSGPLTELFAQGPCTWVLLRGDAPALDLDTLTVHVDDVRADEQRLAAGSVVELYTLDATRIEGGIHRFVPGARTGATLTYQGQEYRPIPIELTGVDYKVGGSASRPTLAISRLDLPFVAAALEADNFRGATLSRLRTLEQYLDGQPEADPERHWPAESWRVERVLRQTRERVVYQLASALDFDRRKLPGRQVLRDVCSWQYRRYTGRNEAGIATWDETDVLCPYTGGRYYNEEDVPVIDPSKDRCSRRISGCKLRFPREPLPFGGFIGVGRVRPRQ